MYQKKNQTFQKKNRQWGTSNRFQPYRSNVPQTKTPTFQKSFKSRSYGTSTYALQKEIGALKQLVEKLTSKTEEILESQKTSGIKPQNKYNSNTQQIKSQDLMEALSITSNAL